jgi:hypothetical protein
MHQHVHTDGGVDVGPSTRGPKDTFITVYGRKPVLEALADATLTVDKVIAADNARGGSLAAILAVARDRGVPVRRASEHRVKVLAGNGHHDQGVLADVVAPRMRLVAEFVDELAGAPADRPARCWCSTRSPTRRTWAWCCAVPPPPGWTACWCPAGECRPSTHL